MKKMNNKTKIIILIVSIIALIGIIFGTTYAYFSASVQDSQSIGGSIAGSLNLSLDVTRISTNANGNLIPISSGTTTLTKAAKGWNTSTNSIGTVWNPTYACKDKKGYTICQVYEIKIKNESSVTVNLNGYVSSLHGENIPNLDCRIMDSKIGVSRTNKCIKIENGQPEYDNFIIATDGEQFTPNEEKLYYIIIFLKDIGTPQTDSGSFEGTVTFSSVAGGSGVSAGFN